MAQSISLLLIDDDPELCGLMKAFFSQQGITVQTATDGKSGLQAALGGGFDLVVLDIAMPGMDGLEVLGRIRKTSAIPVIMLTARTGQPDRIAGLDAGADDYLPKPFEPRELLARIRAVLRRARDPRNRLEVLNVSGLRLDPNTRRVWQDEKEISLTSIPFAILEILMRAAGRIVSRDELAQALYQRAVTPYERTIDVHVSHLRKMLETGGRSYIVTVRGTGYLLRPDRQPR